MNYKKIYDNLIFKATSRGLDKKLLSFKTEKHHIIPRCIGGLNEVVNLVLLTPKEHYVAHHLLYKIYPNNYKLFLAYRMMCIMDGDCCRGKFFISANEYQKLKEKFNEYRKNFIFDENALSKMRKKRKFTENMKKPKTKTEKLKNEYNRRKQIGHYAKMLEAKKRLKLKWYNDGFKNYCLDINDENIKNLKPGRIFKHKTNGKYIIDDKVFYTEKELFNYLKEIKNYNFSFSTWKNKHKDFIKSCNVYENGRNC